MQRLRVGPYRGLVIVGLGVVGGAAWPAQLATAGGGAQNTLVIIDSLDPDSLYLGNYYVDARQVPTNNVIYLSQTASNYSQFVNLELEAVLGELANRGIEDHIDYVVLASGLVYRLPAPSYITDDDCIGLAEFSRLSAYTMAHLANVVLGGDANDDFGLTTAEPNQYFSSTDSAMAFDSNMRWQCGNPSVLKDDPRYLIGAMLGYTGLRGNTPGEIVAMIDSSVAADGSRPVGTFYFMETTDNARSDPRDVFFDDAVTSIIGLGGQAVHLMAVLPEGQHDCLGIMTGWASPQVATAGITLLNGAFCDHLTSWAATFNNPAQTKVSAWIAKGASGSYGTVEEPCAIADKFPHPRMHVFYFQGLSLGESVLRGLGALPYQGLIYGDPLTQPFAYVPTVNVPDAPTGPVSGLIVLTPNTVTSAPGAGIDVVEMFVDGVLLKSQPPGSSFLLHTTDLSDGTHELRIVARDDTPVASQGHWVQSIQTSNHGRLATLEVTPPTGDLGTGFSLAVSGVGGTVVEIRVLQNSRVVAATQSASDTLTVSGAMLGGGPVRLVAEAEFDDGSLACSGVATVSIDFGGACCSADGTCRQLSASACGQLCGAVFAGQGTSCASAPCQVCWTGDFTTDGSVDLVDFGFLQECFSGAGVPPPDNPPGRQADCLCAFDFDGDSDVDLLDHGVFTGLLSGPCPMPVNTGPVAFSYTKDVRGHEPTVVELPATDADGNSLTYAIITPPTQGTLQGNGPTAVLRPGALAWGLDSFEFQVNDGQSLSGTVTVRLRYPDPPTFLRAQVSSLGASGVPVVFGPADLGGATQRPATFTAWFPNDGSNLTLTAPDPDWVSPFVHWVVDGQVQLAGQTQVTVPLDHHVVAVATYVPLRPLAIRANRPAVSITVFTPDYNGQTSGATPFDRVYTVGTSSVVLTAPSSADGHPLRYWKLDGVPQGPGTTFLNVPGMADQHLAVAIYNAIPGDFEDDGDLDAQDFAAFQGCFSGDVGEPGFVPPSAACLSAFDLESPADGDVDLADLAIVINEITGPF